MQVVVSAALEQYLEEKAPYLDIEWRKAVPDAASLAQAAEDFQREKSAMVLLRSSGAEFLAKNPPSIPTFIGGCNHPVQLGAVDNLERPSGNITGVTYIIAHEPMLRSFKAVLKGLNSVVLLYQVDHPGGALDRKGTREACQVLGIQYHDQAVSSYEDRQEAVKRWKGQVSAIILVNNRLVRDRTADAVEAAGDTPILSYSARAVEDGALCGLAANDSKLGRMLGESIIDVLFRSKEIADVPAKTDPDPQLWVNLKTAKRLNITVPASVLKVANIVR